MEGVWDGGKEGRGGKEERCDGGREGGREGEGRQTERDGDCRRRTWQRNDSSRGREVRKSQAGGCARVAAFRPHPRSDDVSGFRGLRRLLLVSSAATSNPQHQDTWS